MYSRRPIGQNITTSSSIWQRVKKSFFVDHKRKEKVSEPIKICQLQQVKVMKILGVTITNGLSVSPHVQSVIVSCAQVLCFACSACP